MGRTTSLGEPTSLTSNQVLAFVNYYLGNPQTGTSQDFGQVNRFSSNASGSLRTDQAFISRAELINFLKSTQIANVNTLQYLGTLLAGTKYTNVATCVDSSSHPAPLSDREIRPIRDNASFQCCSYRHPKIFWPNLRRRVWANC